MGTVLLYWLPRFTWRFFTGAHMDGKERRHQNGKVRPQFKDYFWNRYSRKRRAAIRVSVFGAITGTVVGVFADWWLTRFALLSLCPFAGLWLFKKLLNELTTVHTFTAGDGSPEKYRSLRPKWFRRWETVRGWRFKVRPPQSEAILPDSTESRSILADNAESGGAPVVRLERPLGLTELLTTEGAPEDTRGRSIRRAASRPARRKGA